MEQKKPNWRGVSILADYKPVKQKKVCIGCEKKCKIIIDLNADDPINCIDNLEKK